MSDDTETEMVFEHDFFLGLIPFRENSKIETSQNYKTLKIEKGCKKSKHNTIKCCKIGDGIYTEICLESNTEYCIKLKGRASGNKTKVKLHVLPKCGSSSSSNSTIEIIDASENCLPVSNKVSDAVLKIKTPVTDGPKKYFLVIKFCSKHSSACAYLESINISVVDDEEIVELESDMMYDQEVNNLHILENIDNSNNNLKLLKLSLLPNSGQIIYDKDISLGCIEKYLSISLCQPDENNQPVQEVCHLPLYKIQL